MKWRFLISPPLRFAQGFGFIRNDNSFMVKGGRIGDLPKQIANSTFVTSNWTCHPER